MQDYPKPEEPQPGVPKGENGLRDPEENAKASGYLGVTSLAVVGMKEVIKWVSSLPDEMSLRAEIAKRGHQVPGGSRESLEILLCYLIQRERHKEVKEREPEYLDERIQQALERCRREETMEPEVKHEEKKVPGKKEKKVAAPSTGKKEKKPKEKAASADPATGYRTTTKKFKVYEVWKSGGTEEQATAAALKFLGKSDPATQKSTGASVRAWMQEFERRFSSHRKGGPVAKKAAKGKKK